MTFVGKILVVLHLVLAVIFMAFAGAVFSSQTNWRTAQETTAKQLKSTKDELNAKSVELQTAQDEAKKTQDDLQQQIAQLTGERNTLASQNATLTTENSRVKSAYDAEREVAKLNSEEAAERLKESQIQRARNLELQTSRDELIAKNRTLEDSVFAGKLQLEQLNARHTSLLNDVATMRSFLAGKDLPTDVKDMKVSTSPPPAVDGVVTEYRKADQGSAEFVEISLGSDDGLTKGHTLTVFRNDKYLGRIRLNYVTPDRAVGTVIEKAKNATIERGDNVSTKL